MAGFAVVDIETTGLYANGHDRIIELGVVVMDETGRVLETWETLINPGRDLGPTAIHGIGGAAVRHAPSFGEVADTLSALFDTRVLVAHNLAFDSLFLQAEYLKLGLTTPDPATIGLCTMQLARAYLPHQPVNLGACCTALGIEQEQHHAALSDAVAASSLLRAYLQRDPDLTHRCHPIQTVAATTSWPKTNLRQSEVLPRRVAENRARMSFLERIALRMTSEPSLPEAEASYLDVLDRCLIDRTISDHEADELVGLAVSLGLDRKRAESAHRRYLSRLAAAALADGVLEGAELDDIRRVATALGFTSDDIDRALAESDLLETDTELNSLAFQLTRGDRVVFTGEADGYSRAELEKDALSRGLLVGSSVSRKTKAVFAADPDSLSGKAKKAREAGVPLLAMQSYSALAMRLSRQQEDG